VELEELRAKVESGAVETVVLALTDMQGRLQGKRLTARHFLDEVLTHGAEGCNYLLAVDVEMNTVEGFAMSSWERGYGDFVLRPDLGTLREVPWHPATVMLLADLEWADGSPVLASPRQVLRRQLERLAQRGLIAQAATELEFLVFRDSYEQAWQKGYRDLEPANLYNNDYSLLGTARIEPLIRRIRLAMAGAGLHVENSKGECNLGQHEINFRHTDALRCADEHAIYKNGAKEIAAQEGMAITFMAKFNEREGSSCHMHFSLADAEGPVFDRDKRLFESFLAGQLAHLRELTLLIAPNVNSYKRFAAGSFAPTTVAWAYDNRTCALRVVGHGPSLRFENRAGGGRDGPCARGRVRRQRLPGDRPAPAAGHAGRGSRSVRRQHRRPSGVRGRGRRPLRERRRRGAAGVQPRRHRLGTGERIRAAVSGSANASTTGVTLEPTTSLDAVFAPVRSLTAFEETVDRLGTAIRLGLLPPGTRLPAERELCTRLGIARSTLRQALIALGQSGHLRATRGRGGGTFVADPLPPAPPPAPAVLSAWRDTCDQRLAVEIGVAILAAERASEEALDGLDEIVEELEGMLSDFPSFRQADVRFHVTLAEATGCQPLVTAATAVQGQMTGLIELIAHPPEVLSVSNQQHRRLLDALRRRDEQGAALGMLEHLRGTEHVLAGLLPEL
jgi:glutamine synthetase